MTVRSRMVVFTRHCYRSLPYRRPAGKFARCERVRSSGQITAYATNVMNGRRQRIESLANRGAVKMADNGSGRL